MTLNLKQLMKNFQVVNEAELFCSDMEFRVEEKGITQKVIGDGSKNSSDVQKMCRDQIRELQKTYRAKLSDFEKEIKAQTTKCSLQDAKNIAAYAVYLATYYHPENLDCQQILNSNFKGQKILRSFTDAHSEWFQSMSAEFESFLDYKKRIRKGDDGNFERLTAIVDGKKLFSIPWLLCYQQLFVF